MTHPFCGQDEGEEATAGKIMAISTARVEHLTGHVANKPPVVGGRGDAVWRENCAGLARRRGLGFAAAPAARRAGMVPAGTACAGRGVVARMGVAVR
jgi:hypothetical protein